MGLVAALLATAAAIVYAGIVPVEMRPANGVEWADPGPGLRFERPGIAYSEGELRWDPSDEPGEITVELWVEPSDEPVFRMGQIFSLFDGGAIDPLLVAQWKSGLVVRNRVTNPDGRIRYRELGSLGLLFRDRLHHVALTSGAEGTTVFLDGRETEHRSNIPIVEGGEDFRGRIVLGNASGGEAPWSGVLLGVAVYERRLSREEIAAHGEVVEEMGVAALTGDPGLVALYPFDERVGQAAESRADAGPALRVPVEFSRLRRPVLQMPALRGRSRDAYGRDALLNLLGFAPLGFFAAAALRRRGRRALVAVIGAVALGFALSLAIELFQVMLPARVSSATDLLCNVVGAALGAWVVVRGPWAGRFAPAAPA